MTWSSRQAWFVLAGMSLAMFVGVVGCEVINILRLPGDVFYLYPFAFENHTDHRLTVSFHGHEGTVRPCSVRQFRFLGPTYGTAVELRVYDERNDEILIQEIRHPVQQSDRPMLVQIGEPDASPCPAAADSYVLVVSNAGEDAITIWHEGTLLGSVDPGGRADFGPYSGDWKDIAGFAVRDSHEKEFRIRATSLIVDYDLGSVPEVVYWTKSRGAVP